LYPILFEPFGLAISSFGFMVGIGVVVGTYVGERMFVEARLPREFPWTLALWGFIGGAIGSKLWFVVERLSRDSGANVDWVELLTSRGGITWYGGLIFGLLALWLCSRIYKVSFWTTMHFIAVPLLVAQAIGRIGCFLVGDDYGRETDLPWGVAFPQGAPPTVVPVHPTMLYESAWLALAALLLYTRRHRSPYLFGEYLVLAGLGRFVIEIWRRNPALLGSLSNAQITAICGIAIGASLWLWRSRTPIPLPTENQGFTA
jgi:phosphatidylglycerol---prolipoprotein diacylglyceryl transferase